jgi:chromosome segregation ATPase
MNQATTPRGACTLMKNFIQTTQARITRIRRDSRRTKDQIHQAGQRPQPNLELIAALNERLVRLQQELQEDMNSLQVLEEEFSAACL